MSKPIDKEYLLTQLKNLDSDILSNEYMTKINPTGMGDFSLNRKTDSVIGAYSVAEGCQSTASGPISHAEGYNTIASGAYSHAEGESTNATGQHSHTEGYQTTASEKYSHAEGNGTTASGEFSHAEGNGCITASQAGHAEGFQCKDKLVNNTFAFSNHVEGYVNTLTDTSYSHAEGGFNSAEGTGFNHIEGGYNKLVGQYSHAEGQNNKLYGNYSHEEGKSNYVYSDCAHAEGDLNIVFGNCSHVEGKGTNNDSKRKSLKTVLTAYNSENKSYVFNGDTSSWYDSIKAKGDSNLILYIDSNYYYIDSFSSTEVKPKPHYTKEFDSLVDGTRTYISFYAKELGVFGDYSHMEGSGCTVLGNYSHAEGYSTRTFGNYSHTEGEFTIASGQASHVQGKYNIEDTEEKYAHIVGNGSSDEGGNISRSNAHTLDWDGNAWYAGDVISTKTDGTEVSLNSLATPEVKNLELIEIENTTYGTPNEIWAIKCGRIIQFYINLKVTFGTNQTYYTIAKLPEKYSPNKSIYLTVTYSSVSMTLYIKTNGDIILTISNEQGKTVLIRQNTMFISES